MISYHTKETGTVYAVAFTGKYSIKANTVELCELFDTEQQADDFAERYQDDYSDPLTVVPVSLLDGRPTMIADSTSQYYGQDIYFFEL